MFKGYSIPLMLLAIFVCSALSRIILEIFVFLYNKSWKWYKDKQNANYYLFKFIWFVLSVLLLLFILLLSTFIVPLIVQK